MNSIKKIITSLLVFLLIFEVAFLAQPQRVQAANTLPTTQDINDSNKHYFVALFSWDIWRYSDGVSWTSAGYPGQSNKSIPFTYSFDFPGRKVKSVTVTPFTDPSQWNDGLEIWNRSRYQSISWSSQRIFNSDNYTSTKTFTSGLGTESVTFGVQVVGDLHTIAGKEGEDITHEGKDLDPNVVGYRYYFPSMLTIELEPDGGKAVIKHFTSDGNSLNNVDGFKDYETPLILNRDYTFSHTPQPSNYEYVGWKKSTTGPPSGGSIELGEPYPLQPYPGGYDYYINYYYRKVGTGGGGNSGAGGECTDPAPSRQIEVPLSSPDSRGIIRADQRNNERFEVLNGIPTSESLYGNVFAKSYLHKNKFVQYSGKCTFSVTVNKEYTLKWDPGKKELGPDGKTEVTVPDPQEETEVVTQTHTIERQYSYWTIDNLEIYRIDQAKLWNYAFNGSGITITPSGYSPPVFSTSPTHGYTPPSPPDSVEAPPASVSGGKTKPSLPSVDLKSVAENVVEKVKVKNDSFTFNGSTIMNGSQTTEAGPSPQQIPTSPMIGENVLYSPGNVIPTSKTNKASQPSTGTIFYGIMSGNINGGADTNYPIYGINSVTVHTPVVNYSSISDDSVHNQKTVPTAGRSALILDRPFTVTIPTIGQHQNYLNYGYRDYAKWTQDRQVRFEFGVLTSPNDNSTYIPPGSWISLPGGQDSKTFYLPVWVDEGYYNVYTRSIAENAPNDFTTQTDANLNLQNHVATRTLPVEVIGRIYDFRITDIADFSWESVFRSSPGSSAPRGNYYPVGEFGIDGAANGKVYPFELPIRRGSNPLPGYKNISVKMGYHFKFDLKTKGNMFNTYDSLRIVPSFYFVDMNGKRQQVDLYYHTDSQKFVKIGSAADTQKRYVTLDARLRNVPQTTINDTAGTLYDLFASSSGWTMSRSKYITDYQSSTQKGTMTGGYDVNLLTAPLRTFIGGFDVPTGVSSARKNAAVQQWYGEYSIPSETYVVPKGTNLAEYGRKNKLDEKSSIFLKKGFIIVNFDLMSVRNGDLNNPHLQYINTGISAANQWRREGFNYQFTDPYGLTAKLLDGDVVLYHADKSSRDDLGTGGTH